MLIISPSDISTVLWTIIIIGAVVRVVHNVQKRHHED